MTYRSQSTSAQPQPAVLPSQDYQAPPAVPQVFRRDALTWFAYLLFGAFTYILNTFGPIMPFLRAEQQLSYTQSSLHFSAFALGLIVAGLSSSAVVALLGRARGFLLGGVGLSAGVLLLVLGREIVLTIGGALLIGSFGSLLLVLALALLGDHHGPQRTVAFTEANSLASFCALLAPLGVGVLVRGGDGWWRAALLLGVLALAAVGVAYRGLSIPSPVAEVSSAARERGGLPAAYWRYWLGIVLVVAVEFCILLWGGTFLEQRGLARGNAALALSLFLGAMLVGRLAGTRLVRSYSLRACILSSLGVAALGFLLHWAGPTMALHLAGLAIAGLGVANLYPLTISLAMATVPDRAVLASARSSLASGTSLLLLPLLLGALADQIGIGKAYSVVVVLLVLAFVTLQPGRARS